MTRQALALAEHFASRALAAFLAGDLDAMRVFEARAARAERLADRRGF